MAYDMPHTTSTEAQTQTQTCPVCNLTRAQKTLLPRFSDRAYGHVLCKNCRATYDSNVHQIKAAFAAGLADPKALTDDDAYQEFFVETGDIRGAAGAVYPKFQWDDNAEMQAAIAEDMTQAITRHVTHAPLRILDLGCGNGYTTRGLARSFGTKALTGVDPSPTIHELSAEPAIACFQGTLQQAAFPDAHFDVVAIIGNLMLHDDPSKTMAEVHRILKPGGLIVFDFKNTRSATRIAAAFLARLSPYLAAHPLLQRNFANMRYGLHRGHLPWLCPKQNFDLLEVQSKPPRLLAFGNRSTYTRGARGVIWALADRLDRLRDEQAWLQVVARKHDEGAP